MRKLIGLAAVLVASLALSSDEPIPSEWGLNLEVSWDAVTMDTDGKPVVISSYQVVFYEASTDSPLTVGTVPGDQTRLPALLSCGMFFPIKSIANGKKVWCSVRAIDSVGNVSAWSDPIGPGTLVLFEPKKPGNVRARNVKP
jgi:hypothetical protein